MSRLEQTLYFQLEATDTFVVNTAEIAQLLGIDAAYARQVAHRMVSKGVFEPIKAGLYARIPASILLDKGQYSADPILIASKLLTPYFLSYHTALSLHGLAQRPIQTTYLSTVKTRRRFTYRHHTFQPVKVIPKRFFGFQSIVYQSERVIVSDLERTVLDALSRPKLCGGWHEVICCLSDLVALDWEKLLDYVSRFNAKGVVHRLGYLMSHLHSLEAPDTFLDALKQRRSDSIFYLQGRKKGTLEKTWNLIVPPEVQEEVADVG